MRKYRLRVGLDVDDTLYDCNAYALSIMNARHPERPPVSVNEIRHWGYEGAYLQERIQLYANPDFVLSQPILPGAQDFVRDLAKLADVFFVTAVPPECMSVRAERLRGDFPEVPVSNILIGTRKDVLALDILLDDGGHNISTSRAAYPVLFRKPWNTYLSGLLSVNSYDDFLHLCEMVRNSFSDTEPDVTKGGVLCLVGPTGSLKNEIAQELLKDERFEKPLSTTTRPRRGTESPDVYRFISEEQFIRERDSGSFVETTVYSQHYFGTSISELERIVSRGHCAVLPIDICGAVTLKNLYRNRAMLVFMNRERADVLRGIISKDISEDDMVSRIMSLDFEYRNVEICDAELNVGSDPAAAALALKKLAHM